MSIQIILLKRERVVCLNIKSIQETYKLGLTQVVCQLPIIVTKHRLYLKG